MKSGTHFCLDKLKSASRILGFLQLVFFSPLFCSSEEAFLSANDHFSGGKYEEALAEYEKIGNKGPSTWFNMGNTLYMLGRLPEAMAAWLRSRAGAGYQTFQDSATNIAVASQKLRIEIPPPPIGPGLRTKAVGFLNSFPPFFVQIILLFLLLCFFIFYFSLRRFRFLFFLLFLVILSFYVGYSLVRRRVNDPRLGVVKAENIGLLPLPDTRMPSRLVLKPGEIGHLKGIADKWCRVESKGVEGWCKSDALEFV